MSAPNRLSMLASHLDPSLLGGKREAERDPAVRPAQAPAEPAASAETQSGLAFKEVIRMNLQAAAQHTMLGHKAPSFRECPYPSCQNASNMVPHPVVWEANVTDADLDEIFQRVVPAALEKAVASSPSPGPVEPELPDEPAFIS